MARSPVAVGGSHRMVYSCPAVTVSPFDGLTRSVGLITLSVNVGLSANVVEAQQMVLDILWECSTYRH